MNTQRINWPFEELTPRGFAESIRQAWGRAVEACTFDERGILVSPSSELAPFHYSPNRISRTNVGAFELVLNPYRMIWAERRKEAPSGVVDLDFNNQPSSAKLLEWTVMGCRHLVCTNQYPNTRNNILFIPDAASKLPHVIAPEPLHDALVLVARNSVSNLRLTFNAGSVAHLHFHAYFDEGALPVEKVAVQFVHRCGDVFVSRLVGYPAEALVFEHDSLSARAILVSLFCNAFRARSIRHNLLITPTQVYLFPRSDQRIQSGAYTLGALGMAGRVTLLDKAVPADFDEAEVMEWIRCASCSTALIRGVVDYVIQSRMSKVRVQQMAFRREYRTYGEAYRGDLERTAFLDGLDLDDPDLEREPIMLRGSPTHPSDAHHFRRLGPLLQYVVRQAVRNTGHGLDAGCQAAPVSVLIEETDRGTIEFEVTNLGRAFDFDAASAGASTLPSWVEGVGGLGIACPWIRAYFEQWGIGSLVVESGSNRWVVEHRSCVRTQQEFRPGSRLSGTVPRLRKRPRARPEIVLFDLDGVLFPKSDPVRTWSNVIDAIRQWSPNASIDISPREFCLRVLDLGDPATTRARLYTGQCLDGSPYTPETYLTDVNAVLSKSFGVDRQLESINDWYRIAYCDRLSFDHAYSARLLAAIRQVVGDADSVGFLSDRRVGDADIIDGVVDSHYPGLFRNPGLRIYSYDYGGSKLDGSIFSRLPTVLCLEPEKFLLIDDRLANVERARNAGWMTLHWGSEHPLRFLIAGLAEHLWSGTLVGR